MRTSRGGAKYYILEAELDVILTVGYVLCSLKDSSNFSGVKFS